MSVFEGATMTFRSGLGCAVVVGLAALGCAPSDAGSADPVELVAAETWDTVEGLEDVAADGPRDTASCPTLTEMCANGCGSDSLKPPDCVDSKWTCSPSPWVLISDCPANTCWGTPLPGERCSDQGWECRPDLNPTALSGCPALLCQECTGYQGPTVEGDCYCSCASDLTVKCGHLPDGVPDTADGVPDAVDATDAADLPETPPITGTLHLDPATLVFFELPINSLRMGVSGYDPAAHACASLIWDFSNTGHRPGAHCGDFLDGFPYVIVKLNQANPCPELWDYGTALAVTKAGGCVDFAMLDSPAGFNLVDATADVTGPGFQGTVIADNRHALQPRPVSLGIRYVTDVPEKVLVQSADDKGLPGWVSIRTKDGAPVAAFTPCQDAACGGPTACLAWPKNQVLDFTGTTVQGEVWATWDGRTRLVDSSSGCLALNPAPAGDYIANLCYGLASQPSGGGEVVVTPKCHDVPFTLPTDQVVWAVDNGG